MTTARHDVNTAGSNGTTRRSSAGHVIVVGGGIAGLSCAIRLSERGVRVTLLETRKKLGGRATSFDDVRSGETLDNCQHVVLGCCTAYLDLLERLGVREQIAWTREQYWFEQGGRLSVIRPATAPLPPLPAPVHFGWSFLAAKFLSTSEAVSIGRCCVAMLKVDRTKERHRTFGAFLREHGQTPGAINKFWAPVVISACNLECNRVAASSAIHVFQEGFLAHAHAADVGLSRVPLVRLYERVEELVARAGGQVRLGAGVESLDERSVRTTDGQTLTAERVVCAVPVERVNRVVSESVRAHDPRFAALDRFTHSPILGVHLRLDRDVLDGLPHAVLVERGTQWLFRKSDDGKQIHAVISGADAWVTKSEAEIAELVMADVRACLPRAREAKLETVRAVKEKLATFAPVPGLDDVRPRATAEGPSGDQGVVLAGDYTATGWPATMEGATRSGYAAAAAVLGEPAHALTPGPLPVARLARVLGLRG